MLIVLHCLNLKQQIDLSLYHLIYITFLINSLLDLYVQDLLSLLSLGIDSHTITLFLHMLIFLFV